MSLLVKGISRQVLQQKCSKQNQEYNNTNQIVTMQRTYHDKSAGHMIFPRTVLVCPGHLQ